MKNTAKTIRKVISLILVAVMSLCAVSCNKVEEKEYYDAYFTAMGTQITLRLARNSGQKDGKDIIYHSDEHLRKIVSECSAIAARVESVFSTSDENSLTYEVNGQSDSLFDLNDEFCSLLLRSYEISEKTGGAFDVTIGAITELWNVTAESTEVPSDETVTESLSHTGRDKIVLDGSTITKNDKLAKLDFSAIVKGYALSLIENYLEESDVLYGLVNFGGDVSVFGSKGEETSFKVGITDPANTLKVIGYVYVDGGFVSVCGSYERFFQKDSVIYHHIMDPKTGRPAQSDISSVSVIADDGVLADALSTALFIMGSTQAMEFYNSGAFAFEAVITLNDGTTLVTNGLTESSLFEEYVESEITE